MSTIYTSQTLPTNDNLNRFAFCVDVKKEIFLRKGKMIAYYGNLKFESLGASVLDILVKEAFNSPLYIHDFVVAKGTGKLILGDMGRDIASYDLENGNLTVKASHVLGFEPSLTAQECVVQGYMTLVGTGKFFASSNGPVHFLEAPCRVDEQAMLGWADSTCPAFHYDFAHVQGVLSAVGALTGISLSGEEKQVDFSGAGTVLVQSSEMGNFGNLTTVLNQAMGLGKVEQQSLIASLSQQMRS